MEITEVQKSIVLAGGFGLVAAVRCSGYEGPLWAVSVGRSYRSQGPVCPRTVGPQIQLV
jgi:hypothetical protein